ncbi:hypothetical protein OPQ81_007178 [Rhizoctonia solani]|nr:hypothetical protein OPQ81_007178 [Rhizoctonia solani]
MLAGATKPDTVELKEDTEAISLMLAFIYPVEPPSITTIDQLEKLMVLSQKYGVEKLIKYIENHGRLDYQLVLSDPIRAFRASVDHQFPTIRTLSAKAFGLKYCNYRSIRGIKELAQLFPQSSYVIGLIGAQFVRDEILKNLRTRSGIKPKYTIPSGVSLDSRDYVKYMVCKRCWDQRSQRITSYNYNLGWLSHWMNQLHHRLVYDPLDPCEDLFSIASITGSDGCSDCVMQTLGKSDLFEKWARETKRFVDRELEALEELYSL